MPSPDLILDFARAKRLDPRISFGRNSIGTHYARDGLMKTAPINTPRIEHEPLTGRCMGLLVEESRTNLLTYAQSLSTNWSEISNADTTRTYSAGIDQYGGNTATKIIAATTASAVRSVYQDAASHAAGATLCASVFLRAGEYSGVNFYVSDPATSDVAVHTINLLNGDSSQSVGGASIIYNSGVIALPNNIFRAWLVFKVNDTCTNARPRIYTKTLYSSSVTFTGTVNSGLFAFGAALEAGASPSQFISTTSAAATREADTATLQLGSWYSELGGTILCSFQAPLGITSGTHTICDLHDGTANNRVILQTVDGALQAIVTTGGAEQCSLSLGTLTALADYNVAFAFRANDFSASLNAGVCVTDTSGTIPTVTTMSLGHNYAGGYHLNGSLGRLLYFAARLPDASLRELSR